MGLVLRHRTGHSDPGPSPTPSPTSSPSPDAGAVGNRRPRRHRRSRRPSGRSRPASLLLGPDAAPIAVTEAFGSIWVANIHANDVRRYRPGHDGELARIPVPARGVVRGRGRRALGHPPDRLGPQPDRPGDEHGRRACRRRTAMRRSRSSPSTASGSRPATPASSSGSTRSGTMVVETIPSAGYLFLVLAGGQLIASGLRGLASLDPDTGNVHPASRTRTRSARNSSDRTATTVWVTSSDEPDRGSTRRRPDDRDARLPGRPGRHLVRRTTCAGSPSTAEGVVEIDLATNQARRTIPVPGSPRPARDQRRAVGHRLRQQPPVADRPVIRTPQP